ncbi:MAG: transcription antitermination factor NusB [Elusimicrobia bacterium CG1_02_63_36]|nr:MAG: transcription antitermination factor NusB [Elusimicrobia bacterium CG1_02_63_36]PIP83959.1 MAG: transcription antitermination factor NusB [Elusimicrobia bacterium CG22_combo_CG10-13_8_21_14_all_63_91]PJA17256.1 MAG: transcription antitermination factor NusB [Elusimicrobia bacterium CG_4_10_14_0_2_um_filter_63_34]PJB23863.1 MAG: transcription antitermination factor NusB [Elusimicrobia bacterium CG_4_9_14_3_um_filter_62_55]
MGRRRQGREFALQSLYLIDVGGMNRSEASLTVGHGSKMDSAAREFAEALIAGTETYLASLDEHIRAVARNWELGRMATVDRNLLRLASYELLHCPETPVSVVIDEALEIAKIYSSHDSSKFINGILDKIKLERPANGIPEQPRKPKTKKDGPRERA